MPSPPTSSVRFGLKASAKAPSPGNAPTIAQVQGGGARITVTLPLTIAHPAGTPLAGSGITLTTPLVRAHPVARW